MIWLGLVDMLARCLQQDHQRDQHGRSGLFQFVRVVWKVTEAVVLCCGRPFSKHTFIHPELLKQGDTPRVHSEGAVRTRGRQRSGHIFIRQDAGAANIILAKRGNKAPRQHDVGAHLRADFLTADIHRIGLLGDQSHAPMLVRSHPTNTSALARRGRQPLPPPFASYSLPFHSPLALRMSTRPNTF